jgi:hypothetical protein
MTFTSNLRAIIFESRPVSPRFPTLIIQATADEVPLATYCCLQSGAKHLRDESTHAGLHTDVSQIIKYRKKKEGKGVLNQHNTEVNFCYIPLKQRK